MKKKLWALGLLLSVAAYGREIGLPEVLERLKTDNYEIKSQEQQVEIEALNVKQGFKRILPGATLEVDTQILNNERYKDMGEVFGPQKVTAGYTIYSGGRVVNNYRKLKKDYGIAERDLETVKQNTEIRAVELYFQVLNLKKQLEITEYARTALVKQQKRLDILFSNNKMVSKNELLEVEADILGIDGEILLYRDEMRLAKERLFVLIGENLNSDFDFLEYSEKFPMKNREELERDIERARIEGNTALKKSLEVEKAELDVKIAKADFLPTVRVNGEYRLDDDIKVGRHRDFGVELEASMNIFQWGATLDDVRSKKIALERKSMEKANTLQNLAVDIRGRYSRIKQLTNELELATERSRLLEENSRIQNIRFTNGLLSSLDYLESIQLLRRAEERRYATQKQLILANREYNNLIK